ncbi:5-formyltetrahydrofolate cyclo-ligase [Aquisphaera insulae]|uniref:5-formyltetrahydrofolate cyclo-ligase n=1 Tax=Aquisphaera insulae TaxID=2712864 RepID=UPI0013EB94E9|nr:5-formyltetrahydrofolate cyclo-ligase [Aquisphaera insulae]
MRQVKRALRRSVIASILAMDPAKRSGEEQSLRTLFEELPGYPSATTVLLYVKAFPEEIDTGPLLESAIAAGKRLACPRVDRDQGRLRLFVVRSLIDDLAPGTLNIPEPAGHCEELGPTDVDWVLVPGVGFDPSCYRVGRGAGHYDRLLPKLRVDAPRHALGYECQVVERLPIEAHDVPIDGVHTPTRTFARV